MSGTLADRVRALATPAQKRALLQAVGDAWAAEANALAPVGPARASDSASGAQGQKLKGGITFEVESEERGSLVLPAHARYLILGTKSHPIVPRAGRVGRNGRPAALQFTAGGTVLYRRRVTVGGITPRPFVWQAWRSPRVQGALRAAGILLVRH